jgi:hypothetical protein
MLEQFCRIQHKEPSCPHAQLSTGEYWQGTTLERLIGFEWRAEYGEFLVPKSRSLLERLLSRNEIKIESEPIAVAVAGLQQLAELLDDPPWEMRRDRRISQGALPEAERVHEILEFVLRHARCALSVEFEVWDKTSGRRAN